MKCLLVLLAAMVLVLLPVSCKEMCGRPGSPQNGTFVYENENSASYTCDEGFVILGGDKIRHCVNGTWTGDVPRCAKTRQVVIDGGVPYKPAVCYDIFSRIPFTFYFKEATIYSIEWETNIQSWTESKIEWPFYIHANSTEGLQYLANRTEIKHFEIGDLKIIKVALHEPMPNVSMLLIVSDVNSVICNLYIIAIETEENCEEPDSPLYGQHVWNRNDSVATFQCDDNFNLTSDLPLNCVGGKWIGSQPKCEAGGLPVTTGVPIVVINQEELDVSGETDYLPVTTDLPVTREEKHLDVSGEDDNLPVTAVVPIAQKEQVDGSGEPNYLPVYIGVPIAIIIVAAVIAAIIYNCSPRTGKEAERKKVTFL